ncbi:hypothetical protein phi1422_0057 [Bdellovibrio phage phi1422]|uniref:hypothetical protein n=1 Tax=Bdellovibrio phage phi1422 TaxID=1127515 RepID=UPI0002536D6D|nr:hypothetical protein F395_gp57 [Bdellovibrio phage phi1422]AFC22577.1 hypothetical protein phi1422_0057 [Bdellovibrio phage phi1422]
MAFKTHRLQSGAELKIGPASFRESKTLFDNVLKVVGKENWNPEHEVDINFIKGIVSQALSSEDVERALWPCLARSTYNGHKITEDLFEDVKLREDFLEICYEVGKENVLPFTKNLLEKFSHVFQEMGIDLKQKS